MIERIDDILFEIKLFFRSLWWKFTEEEWAQRNKSETVIHKMNEYLKNHPNHKGYIVKPVSRGGNEYRTCIGGEFYKSSDGITWTLMSEDDFQNEQN